jgi:hypothetical protein
MKKRRGRKMGKARKTKDKCKLIRSFSIIDLAAKAEGQKKLKTQNSELATRQKMFYCFNTFSFRTMI